MNAGFVKVLSVPKFFFATIKCYKCHFFRKIIAACQARAFCLPFHFIFRFPAKALYPFTILPMN